jgi:hypothetical protein
MRRLYKFIVPLIFLPLLMGMGSLFGRSSPDKIPVPEKKFMATFIDQMDITAQCTEASIEGETIIEGKHGKGVYTVSFDKIKSVIFYLKNGELIGTVRLKDESTVSLVLKKDSRAYGKTKYGTFYIKLGDLKKVIIYPGHKEVNNKDKNRQ